MFDFNNTRVLGKFFNSIKSRIITYIRQCRIFNFKGSHNISEMILKPYTKIVFLCYNFVFVTKGRFLIFESIFSKIWFSFPNVLLIVICFTLEVF